MKTNKFNIWYYSKKAIPVKIYLFMLGITLWLNIFVYVLNLPSCSNSLICTSLCSFLAISSLFNTIIILLAIVKIYYGELNEKSYSCESEKY
jgi:hypothetical protein